MPKATSSDTLRLRHSTWVMRSYEALRGFSRFWMSPDQARRTTRERQRGASTRPAPSWEITAMRTTQPMGIFEAPTEHLPRLTPRTPFKEQILPAPLSHTLTPEEQSLPTISMPKARHTATSD